MKEWKSKIMKDVYYKVNYDIKQAFRVESGMKMCPNTMNRGLKGKMSDTLNV